MIQAKQPNLPEIETRLVEQVVLAAQGWALSPTEAEARQLYDSTQIMQGYFTEISNQVTTINSPVLSRAFHELTDAAWALISCVIDFSDVDIEQSLQEINGKSLDLNRELQEYNYTLREEVARKTRVEKEEAKKKKEEVVPGKKQQSYFGLRLGFRRGTEGC